jgi:hypothetical protein
LRRAPAAAPLMAGGAGEAGGKGKKAFKIGYSQCLAKNPFLIAMPRRLDNPPGQHMLGNPSSTCGGRMLS